MDRGKNWVAAFFILYSFGAGLFLSGPWVDTWPWFLIPPLYKPFVGLSLLLPGLLRFLSFSCLTSKLASQLTELDLITHMDDSMPDFIATYAAVR